MDLVLDQYAAFARYNRWMNEKVYAAVAALSDGERRRDLGAFFRSIHGTLNHLVLTDRAWLGRFTRDRTVSESRHARGEPIPMTGLLAGLTVERLAAPFAYRTTRRRGLRAPALGP